MKKLLARYRAMLEIAKAKEATALKENKETKAGDSYRIAVKFSNWTNAQGYTNAILDCIDELQRQLAREE